MILNNHTNLTFTKRVANNYFLEIIFAYLIIEITIILLQNKPCLNSRKSKQFCREKENENDT